jgi:predicted kinase
MKKILVLQGLPGAGKTTWAKEYVTTNKDAVRVCRDDLRRMRGIYWLPEQEDLITKWEDNCVVDAILNGHEAVIDATNLNPKVIAKWERIAKHSNCPIEFKMFDITLDEAIKRDNERIEGKVGEKVIRGMYEKYFSKPQITLTQNDSLPRAIICDLDGTLAIHNGRNPFDYDKCDTDLVNRAVQSIVMNYLTPIGTKTVLFMSGREDKCKDKTLKWLREKAGIFVLDIIMRKTGDFRPDDIVKKELFDNNIKDKFYIDFVLDDRDKVVKMWRDIGLTCLQVNYGNF